jgi:hypothetical protein
MKGGRRGRKRRRRRRRRAEADLILAKAAVDTL